MRADINPTPTPAETHICRFNNPQSTHIGKYNDIGKVEMLERSNLVWYSYINFLRLLKLVNKIFSSVHDKPCMLTYKYRERKAYDRSKPADIEPTKVSRNLTITIKKF